MRNATVGLFALGLAALAPQAAQAAGYRACKRCLPDATPGSPDWDVAATAVAVAVIATAMAVRDRRMRI